MRISVALATYNGAKYIVELLESLCAQSRKPDEVIVSDDASGDDTVSLIRAFIEKRGLAGAWRIVENDRNAGYRENFRRAVSLAGGDIIALCDQDDIWEPEKLRAIEREALTRPDGSAFLTSFSCMDANGANLPIPARRGRANHGLMPYRAKERVSRVPARIPLVRNVAMGCCMAYRRDVCARFCRLSRGGLPHDWELLLGASFAGAIYYIDEPLVRYRVYEGNTIGLPGLFESGKKRPSGDGREAILREYDAVLDSAAMIASDMGLPPVSPRYIEYAAVRKSALRERSARKWISLFRYRDIYAAMFSAKQRLGDLYVILRGKREK